MNDRQINAWNWSATTNVYVNGFKDCIASFDTEQYWNGTKSHHESLMKQLVERLEDMSDRLGLQYRVHRPVAIAGHKWADRTPESIDVDRFPV
jgi:hypothetical protein